MLRASSLATSWKFKILLAPSAALTLLPDLETQINLLLVQRGRLRLTQRLPSASWQRNILQLPSELKKLLRRIWLSSLARNSRQSSGFSLKLVSVKLWTASRWASWFCSFATLLQKLHGTKQNRNRSDYPVTSSVSCDTASLVRTTLSKNKQGFFFWD